MLKELWPIKKTGAKSYLFTLLPDKPEWGLPVFPEKNRSPEPFLSLRLLFSGQVNTTLNPLF